MIETPHKGLRKYQTIDNVQKNNKSNLSTTAFRSKQRNSSSLLINPEIVLNMTLPNIENSTSLPKIKERRKQKKKGTFLQSWLDQALGSPDPFAIQKESDDDKIQGSVLKTLKKFQLDKRHLQSQNIPSAKIEKLYKSLYIYSYGVNKIFEELLQLTRQAGNTQLIGNFWKAYAKLLQSCTSYQTVFQKIQKQHLGNIQRLKRNIETKSQNFHEQKKALQQKITKLERSLQQKQMRYNNLNNQFDVLQNTLDLTDQAFNEQVNLRLKFQQKINAVYTSYQQLKIKYTKIVQEMGVKNMDIIDRDNKQSQLKNKLLVQKTKVDELMFLLKAERDKVQQRQTQIIIKAQELQDVKQKLLAKENLQENTQDKMQQHLSKLKAIKIKLLESQTVAKGQKITIKQQQQHIKKLCKSLEQYKQLNNQIYQKYAVSGKKIVQLQSNIQFQSIKIVDLEKSVMQKSIEITNFTKQLDHVRNQRDNLRHDLNISTKNLKDTADTMTKNSLILEQMKAVKDKYQRINQYMKDDLKQLETSHNKIMQQLSLKTEQLQGMKLLLQNRNKSLIQMQKQIEQQKQLNKVKITSLNTTITKKQNLVIQIQKSIQQHQKKYDDLKCLQKITEDKCILVQSEKLKVEVQLSSKTKLIKQLEDILDKENIRYRQLNNKFEGQLKQKTDISSKLLTTSYVLKTKNQQQRIQVKTLESLLNGYKAKIIQRAQYVHPMLYEQALQIARRCYENQQKAIKDTIKLKKSCIQLTSRCEKLEQNLKQKTLKIQGLQAAISKLSQQKNKLTQKYNKTDEKLKNINGLYQKQQKTNKKHAQNFVKKQQELKNVNEKMILLQSNLSELKTKNQELTIQNNKRKISRAETREHKKQVKKQTVEQSTQYQQQQQQINDRNQKIGQIIVQKSNQQTQTQNTTQPQRQQSPPVQNLQSMYKQIKQQGTARKEKEYVPQKKVQSKQFRNALKLTYMRR